MGDRTLAFPDDVAIGFLSAYIGDAEVVWGPARGRVRIPAAAEVHLRVSCPIQGLGMLGPDDVFSIRLEKKKATDTDLGRLAHLTGLRELRGSKSHAVTDAGLAAIAPLRRLKALDLYASGVTDAGLVHLSGMVELEFLHLGATRLAGPGLAHLVGLQRLAYLKLEGTDVDDAAVPHLLRMRGLQRIILGDTRLTTRGLARLRSAFPGLWELYMPQPGLRLARERAQAAVLGILARRLLPGLPDGASPERALQTLLPVKSQIAEIRFDGGPVKKAGWGLDELDVVARWLPKLAAGCDLRIVTPAGLDVWVPWLRARGTDRRRTRRTFRASTGAPRRNLESASRRRIKLAC